MPLNAITLGPVITDKVMQVITLSELLFPMNEASSRKRDLLKLPKLNPLETLSMIPLSDAHCKIFLGLLILVPEEDPVETRCTNKL